MYCTWQLQIVSYFCPSKAVNECKELLNDSSSCWLFVTDDVKTWGDAAQTCTALGGRLAVETDSDVRDALVAEMTEGGYSPTERWWFGLRNTYFEDVNWQWGSWSQGEMYMK